MRKENLMLKLCVSHTYTSRSYTEIGFLTRLLLVKNQQIRPVSSLVLRSIFSEHTLRRGVLQPPLDYHNKMS